MILIYVPSHGLLSDEDEHTMVVHMDEWEFVFVHLLAILYNQSLITIVTSSSCHVVQLLSSTN